MVGWELLLCIVIAYWVVLVCCEVEVYGVETELKGVVDVLFCEKVDFDEGVLVVAVLLLVGFGFGWLGVCKVSGSCVYYRVGVDEELLPVGDGLSGEFQ